MRKKYFGIIIGGFTLILNKFGHHFPELVERFYSRGVFVMIRQLLDTLLTWLPFPALYLFFLGMIIFWILGIKKFRKNKRPFKQRLRDTFISWLNGIGWLIFWFYWIWGFNYARIPIEVQLGLEVKPITLEQIEVKMKKEAHLLDSIRQQIHNSDTMAITNAYLNDDLEVELRANLVHLLKTLNYPTPGRVRGKLIYPKGIFLHFSSAGLYFPFVGEGNIDAGIHALQMPSVITHEMSHGYGFGDEGTCNFLAFIANERSKSPIIAYAAHLSYYRTLAGNYLHYYPKEYSAFRKTLPVGIVADLNAINENSLKYPDWMPKLRYFAYDQYLKSQGIKEGIENYNRVLMLVDAWQRR
ncbi:MAG TPA: DUF3810 domain-containing protein [Saprospiraceae bacterium]|nr:DUF3810 domain-containing protein [Saprospiraceae bacterium]